MQLVTDPAVRDLITGRLGYSRSIRAGAEVVTLAGEVVRDVSGSLIDGSVSRNNYATIHGTCSVTIGESLSWGSDILRLYQVWDDGHTSARFDLGEFVMETPTRDLTRPVWDVTGYDRMKILDRPIGDAYVVEAGQTYQEAILRVIADSGEIRVHAEESESSQQLISSPLVYPIFREQGGGEDMTTWLQVINELAQAVGYQGVWYDTSGFLRLSVYRSPTQRAPEWDLNASDPYLSNVQDGEEDNDVWGVPNVWVFYNTTLEDQEPIEGNGLYIVRNQSEGPTSIDALGYEKVVSVGYDASSQANLIALGDNRVAADKRVTRLFDLEVAPIPVAGHFDLYSYNDPRVPFTGRLLARSYEIPLRASGGFRMQLSAEAVV